MRRNILTIVALLLAMISVSFAQQAKQPPPPPPKPAASALEETLASWNETGRKLIAMAEDFPEDKYDFKPTPEVRSFRAQLLHAAGSNYFFIEPVAGKKMGDASDDPDPAKYKTKADVVAFLKKSVEDGATVMKAQGEAGLTKEINTGRRMRHAQAWWTIATGHGAEHYGQLVVYYRLNKLVPPESRR